MIRLIIIIVSLFILNVNTSQAQNDIKLIVELQKVKLKTYQEQYNQARNQKKNFVVIIDSTLSVQEYKNQKDTTVFCFMKKNNLFPNQTGVIQSKYDPKQDEFIIEMPVINPNPPNTITNCPTSR